MVCRGSRCGGGWCRKALRGSAEWLVLLFLLWPSQFVSLRGRRTLLRCLTLLPLRLRMPVELVRGGMALGEAKGCEVEAGIVGSTAGRRGEILSRAGGDAATHSPAQLPRGLRRVRVMTTAAGQARSACGCVLRERAVSLQDAMRRRAGWLLGSRSPFGAWVKVEARTQQSSRRQRHGNGHGAIDSARCRSQALWHHSYRYI